MDLLSDLPPETGAAPVPVAELTPLRLASPEQVAALVGFGRSEKVVSKWTYERAGLLLNDLIDDAKWSANAYRNKAAAFDGPQMMPEITLLAQQWKVDRADAGEAVAQAVEENDPERLGQMVKAAVSCLTEAELFKLAKHFVTKFKPQELEAVR